MTTINTAHLLRLNNARSVRIRTTVCTRVRPTCTKSGHKDGESLLSILELRDKCFQIVSGWHTTHSRFPIVKDDRSPSYASHRQPESPPDGPDMIRWPVTSVFVQNENTNLMEFKRYFEVRGSKSWVPFHPTVCHRTWLHRSQKGRVVPYPSLTEATRTVVREVIVFDKCNVRSLTCYCV